MNVRDIYTCPVCGSRRWNVIHRYTESSGDSLLTALCIECQFHRNALVSRRILYFLLRVVPRDYPGRPWIGRPWLWQPLRGILGIFRCQCAALMIAHNAGVLFPSPWSREDNRYSSIGASDSAFWPKLDPLFHECEKVAEHRLVRPLIEAILRSSGNTLVRENDYLRFTFGSVGQPLAS
jgi:hypothetical protein